MATSALSSPQAVTAELTAIAKFNAAFKSRSQLKLQCSQLKTRSDNNRDSLTVPHLLQVLELAIYPSQKIMEEE